MVNDLIKHLEDYREFLISNKGYSQEEADIIVSNLKQPNNSRPKKYGLVWEEKAEKVCDDLKKSIPYLEEYQELRILKGGEDAPHHLLIEGDNLEALNLLMVTHKNKVNVCYIDPPYNTGKKDFKYNDAFIEEDNEWRHSTWLSFMSKRLKLAKELLSDDGVIFISIDEHEFAQLKLLCDEIFGERNFIENFIWVKNSTKNNSKTTSTNHEYILTYCRDIEKIKNSDIFRVQKNGLKEVEALRDDFIKNEKHLFDEPHLELEKRLKMFYKENTYFKGISSYKYVEPNNLRIFTSSDLSAPGGNGGTYDVLHPITNKPCKLPSRGYRCKEETMIQMIENNEILFGKDEKTTIRAKRYLDTVETEVVRSMFINNDDGKKELAKIFGESPFSYPKPVSLIKHCLQMIPNKEAIVLDFFAGSGTTGHAVLELNQKDGGSRKFILCTNNENNICEEVTYPRLNKVINGYSDSKDKEIKGLPANLHYYKIKSKLKSSDLDDDAVAFLEKGVNTIAIKEDVFGREDFEEYYRLSNENKKVILHSDFNALSDDVLELVKKEFEDLNDGTEKVIYTIVSDLIIDGVRVKPYPKELLEELINIQQKMK